jgi:hypothetical protein
MERRTASVRTVACGTRAANDIVVSIQEAEADAAYVAEGEFTLTAEVTEGRFIDDPILRRTYQFLEMGGECFSIKDIRTAGQQRVMLTLMRDDQADGSAVHL